MASRTRLPRRGARVALLALMLAAPLASMLSGCAAVPSQEMSDARRAVDAARDAQAPQHAPAAMERAAGALERASEALRAGDYDRARALATTARDEAIAARMLADQVAQVEHAIADARAGGRPWRGAAALLDEALAASSRGDSERALKLAERALALAR